MPGSVAPIPQAPSEPRRAGFGVVVLAAGLVAASGCVPWTPPGGGQAKGCVQDAQLAVPLASRLGVASHLEWGASDQASAYRDFEAGAWGGLSVGMVRTDFSWSRVEPEKGAFDFEGLDRVVDAAEAAGVELLAILDYGNAWAASSGDDRSPPDDVADFGDYVEAVATRYRGRVRYYEVWNEPNVGYVFWHPTEDPSGYAVLLAEASQRLRAADPEAFVSFAGLFQPDLFFNTEGEDYLRQTAAAADELAGSVGELGRLVDAVAFHPYRYPFTAPELQDDSQESLVATTCRMAEALDDLGLASLPLWMTELGWHTAPDALAEGVSEADQAAYLARSALLSFGQGVEQYTWYTFRDSGVSLDDQEQMFGLYGFDDDPTAAPSARAKPSAVALATLARALGDHDRIVDLSAWLGLDADTYAYRLTGGQPTTTALWTVGPPATVRLPAVGDATLVALDGSETDLRWTDGVYEVEVSGTPVFVEAARAAFPDGTGPQLGSD